MGIVNVENDERDEVVRQKRAKGNEDGERDEDAEEAEEAVEKKVDERMKIMNVFMNPMELESGQYRDIYGQYPIFG